MSLLEAKWVVDKSINMERTFFVISLWMIYDTHIVVKQIRKRLTFIVIQGQPKELE